jgi:hypothetical protein
MIDVELERRERGCNVGITDGGFTHYFVEMVSGSIAHIPSFTSNALGVQAILRFCFNSLRGCNVVITDGRDLCSISLRWPQVSQYTYDVRHTANIKVNTTIML